MSESLVIPIILALALSIVSAGYTYFRARVLASADQITAKGLAAASRDTAVFYAGVSVVVGVIGFFVFRGMFNASPGEAQRNFLLLALGIGVVLEIMAAVVFKMRGIMDLTLLHVVHIVGYGWLMPLLLVR
jgi:hypothetical protein